MMVYCCEHMTTLMCVINVNYRKCCGINNDYSLLREAEENMLLYSVSKMDDSPLHVNTMYALSRKEGKRLLEKSVVIMLIMISMTNLAVVDLETFTC